MKRTYTKEELTSRYNKLSNPKKVEVLLEALNFMQQYNGRSRLDCIILAMGYYETGTTGIYEKEFD